MEICPGAQDPLGRADRTVLARHLPWGGGSLSLERLLMTKFWTYSPAQRRAQHTECRPQGPTGRPHTGGRCSGCGGPPPCCQQPLAHWVRPSCGRSQRDTWKGLRWGLQAGRHSEGVTLPPPPSVQARGFLMGRLVPSAARPGAHRPLFSELGSCPGHPEAPLTQAPGTLDVPKDVTLTLTGRDPGSQGPRCSRISKLKGSDTVQVPETPEPQNGVRPVLEPALPRRGVLWHLRNPQDHSPFQGVPHPCPRAEGHPLPVSLRPRAGGNGVRPPHPPRPASARGCLWRSDL